MTKNKTKFAALSEKMQNDFNSMTFEEHREFERLAIYLRLPDDLTEWDLDSFLSGPDTKFSRNYSTEYQTY